jgi:3-isopropylmalate/(R)-2-methylmalate dehydratase small subunit
MDKFTSLTGVAAPLPIINIDTDMIIPKQYLKTIKRTGLGTALFSEMRYNEDGSENPDFVLNKPAYRKAQIIIAGDNFGCGSSREHAAWALLDLGIEAVIAPSFSDIFAGNAFKNGILTVALPQQAIDRLMEVAETDPISIDLEHQTVTTPFQDRFTFEIDPFRKHCLIEGLDEVALTLTRNRQIEAYEARLRAEQPWVARGTGLAA